MSMNPPEGPFCQSCGMPMKSSEDFGTNADSSRNEEYCTHCFQNGEFTEPEMTMEQMIEKVTGFMVSHMNMPEKEVKEIVKTFIPKLKRWKVK